MNWDLLRESHSRNVLELLERLALIHFEFLLVSSCYFFTKKYIFMGSLQVLGKFHPHGDNAVYDSLVRMAQVNVRNFVLVFPFEEVDFNNRGTKMRGG